MRTPMISQNDLLERKILCFESFLKISSQALESLEKDDISELDLFQKRRNTLIQILKKIDAEIAALNTSTNTEKTTLQHKRIEKIILSILDTDKKITENISRLKSSTLSQISQLSNSRKTISAYKSPLESLENQENRRSSFIKA